MSRLKLNDKLCEEICKDIKEGVPIVHAAAAHGITHTTFYGWYNKGKSATRKNKFRDFYERVEEAKSEAIRLRAKRICKAGEFTWQADAWWLERVDPDNFGRKVKADVESNVTADVKAEVKLSDLFDDETMEKILNDTSTDDDDSE